MKNSINDKTSPNQMRILMKRMREMRNNVVENNVNEIQDVPKKDLSVRDMLKLTRNYKVNLNEDVVATNNPTDDTPVNPTSPETTEKQDVNKNKKTAYDQEEEEEKFRNYFDDMNVDIKFTELSIYDNLIFWGGTIDGVIQFVYKVTPDEKTTGIEFNYLPDFTADNPDNDLIIKKIESYFDIFYKYWRNNVLQN